MKGKGFFNSLMVFLLLFGSLSCTSREKQAEKHFRAGFEYQDRGNLDKAIEEYQQALRLKADYLEVYMNMGTVYLEKKDYDQAIQQFKRVVELSYYYGKAHYDLGMVYLYQGDKEKAEEELKALKSMGSGLADNLERKITEK
ncbi:MAG: tetratricopeptide repeat protein [Candidatus Zixiibacteriota bacterium]